MFAKRYLIRLRYVKQIKMSNEMSNLALEVLKFSQTMTLACTYTIYKILQLCELVIIFLLSPEASVAS